MNKLKVMTVLGTRPEIIKLSRVIPALDRHMDHVLVHTGQNFADSLSAQFFEELKIRPFDHWLGVGEHARSSAHAVAQVIDLTDKLIEIEKPDAFLVYGDTNSCLSAYAAKRRKVPVFHLEAGNRCFDERVPEEINRRIIDHISDVNICLTEHARRNLIAEGVDPSRTFVIGSPMPEIIEQHRGIIGARPLPLDLAFRKFFLASFHREENVDNDANLLRIMRTLNELVEAYPENRVIVSTHPRTRACLSEQKLITYKRVEFCEPFSWLDWMALQTSARCVLSDSGSLTEEACCMRFPAVMLREQHERPEGQDLGAVIVGGLDPDRVLQAVSLACEGSGAWAETPYGDNKDFSGTVVRLILGYTDVINRVVWHKA